MKKILLSSLIILCCLSMKAQIVSVVPNQAPRGNTLTTVITAAFGTFSMASPPGSYSDIYLQQGATIIYTYAAFDQYVNVYGAPFFTDSLFTQFTIPSNAPYGYYDVHVLSNFGFTHDILPNGFLVKDFAGYKEGVVFADTNQNGIRDAGEIGLAGHRVQAMPGSFTAYTDFTGHYKLFLDSGNYTLTYLPPTFYNQTSLPATYSVACPPSDTGYVFGTYSSQLFGNTQLMYVWNHPMRCAPSYGYTNVNLLNTSNAVEQGSVTIVHSANMPFVSSVPMPDVINGDTLIWYYNNLLPGNTHSITGWITFQDPPAGQTVWYSVFDTLVNGLGIPINAYTNFFSFAVTCSCDPNEKEVFPAGTLAQHYTAMDADLIYTLNFQNTGNDTAFNVIIYDTLDANLDLNTFEVMSSSSTVHTQMLPTGVLRFSFENILLPDSNVDEARSHGWVAFRIRADSLLPDPTAIHNLCYIYFDANDAVITNRTTNTLTWAQYPSANYISANTTFCSQTCVNFSNLSQNGTTYQWIFPGGSPATSTDVNPTACYGLPGSYDVTLIASNILGSDTLTQNNYLTVYPSPAAPTISQSNDTLFSSLGNYVSYQWYQDSVLIGGATNSYYVALQNGNYNLVVTDSNGCQVGGGIANVMTGVNAIRNINTELKIYPNPAKDNLTITFRAVSPAILDIVNSLGQVVYSKEIKSVSGENKLEINNEHLSDGIYLLKITSDNNVMTKKIVIEK